ncbi:hypothetical protein BJ165DRAFT_1409217 [Panaeolus papilionaceus]|nr:hypothetical protein BJ165DRAFT_1409217 [Panaeolus papilionaceus]
MYNKQKSKVCLGHGIEETEGKGKRGDVNVRLIGDTSGFTGLFAVLDVGIGGARRICVGGELLPDPDPELDPEARLYDNEEEQEWLERVMRGRGSSSSSALASIERLVRHRPRLESDVLLALVVVPSTEDAGAASGQEEAASGITETGPPTPTPSAFSIMIYSSSATFSNATPRPPPHINQAKRYTQPRLCGFGRCGHDRGGFVAQGWSGGMKSVLRGLGDGYAGEVERVENIRERRRSDNDEEKGRGGQARMDGARTPSKMWFSRGAFKE